MAGPKQQGKGTLDALKEQRAKINARIKKAQRAEEAKQRERHKKRCEIAGAIILAEAENDNELRANIYKLLGDKLTRKNERELFEWPQETEKESAAMAGVFGKEKPPD